MKNVDSIMKQLGGSRCKLGFHFTKSAIELLLEDESRFLNLSHRVYPKIAMKYNVNIDCVERNIRTLLDYCYSYGNRAFFDELIGYESSRKPTVSEFLDMIYSYISDK